MKLRFENEIMESKWNLRFQNGSFENWALKVNMSYEKYWNLSFENDISKKFKMKSPKVLKMYVMKSVGNWIWVEKKYYEMSSKYFPILSLENGAGF